MSEKTYMNKRKQFSSLLFERALPNEYLVEVGKKNPIPVLGGKKLKLFSRFLRIPAYVQKLSFTTDNANIDYQGIGIEGYAGWRINPEKPQIAIATLDFFDETDPMTKTNEALKTICIEAVRHVIANMTIEQALKNKDEIADNLKQQLKAIEDKWGIVFDHVGIEKVRIMSNKLFTDLQSDYRNKLHEESEKKRIATQRNIAKEQNHANEKNKLEELETSQKVSMIRINNTTQLRVREIEEHHNVEEKERLLREENYRQNQIFDLEKQEKEFELKQKQQQIQIQTLQKELELLKAKNEAQQIEHLLQTNQLEIEKLSRETLQQFSPEFLTNELITRLPEIFKAFRINNYSVMETGDQKSVSPVVKIIEELLFVIQKSDLVKKKQ